MGIICRFGTLQTVPRRSKKSAMGNSWLPGTVPMVKSYYFESIHISRMAAAYYLVPTREYYLRVFLLGFNVCSCLLAVILRVATIDGVFFAAFRHSYEYS
jgi:hypothetical protein